MSDLVMELPEKEQDSVLLRVEALYDQGLYRQALDAADAAWGPASQWRSTEQAVLGSRILSHLGCYRTSVALVLRCWRRESRDFELCFAYVRTLMNHRGPYLARRALLQFDSMPMADEQRARWLGLAAFIHGTYRDWEKAHACVDEAMRLAVEPGLFHYERSWLYELQDRYEEALQELALFPTDVPNQLRMQMYGRSRLLEISGHAEQSLQLLQDAFQRFESVDVGMSLHSRLTASGNLDAADACLDRIRALVPASGMVTMGEDISIAHADILYRRGDYDGALAALAPVRGYYFRQVRESLEKSRHEGIRCELDVPFIRQHHMTCAPATLAALWRYHGHVIDHLTLAEAICYDGTSDLAERRWIEGQGWAIREFELNLDDVRRLIDAGCPIGLSTVEPGSAHMQAIIGYDTRKGIYLLRDPYYPSVRELLIEGAHEAYAATGPRCMVAVPPERRDWLYSLPLRQADRYDEYFLLQQALDDNRREDALTQASLLEVNAPGHRLSLWAQRSLAHYDNDILRQLAMTNALLEQFPRDLNLLAAKSRMLGDLGREAERLQFLEATCRFGINHPYLTLALAEQMAKDNRRTRETRRLLHDILKRQPLNSSAWWVLAGQHWDALEREEAFDCYRLCVCIEDKVEAFASSYFKAARFLRRGDEALAYLARRIEWLGKLSANPFITYARALDLLERTPDVLGVLETALQQHPEDAWLVAESFDYLASAGEYRRAEALLAEKGHVLSEVVRLYKQARLMQVQADAPAELACFQRILALQPRNDNAASNVARLLHETVSLESALAFLDEKLEANPYNLWLLHEKLRYVNKLPLATRRPLIEAMHGLHPEDARLAAAQARIWRGEGRHAEALALIRQAVAIDPDTVWLHLVEGDICMEQEDAAAARSAYEKAILISVDAENAFAKLLDTHVTFEEKKGALKFIHAELMRQVSFGNGILEFQSLARRYLPDADVHDFLRNAVELRPDLWQSWVGLGSFLLNTNQLDQAASVLDEAVKRFPLLPRVLLERGEVARLQQDYERAEQSIRAAIDINPNYGLAVTKLADVLELRAQPAEALAAIEKGLRLDPMYTAYYGYQSDLLWRMERHDEAFDAVYKVLKIDPDYGWGWDRLREWGAVLNRHAEIEVLVRLLLDKFPDSAWLWRQCAASTEDRALKHEWLQKAIDLAPHQNDALLARCDLLVEEGLVHEARALLDSHYAGRAKPSEVSTYDAWLIRRTGRLNEAIVGLEAVVREDPGHYNAWRMLMQWHSDAGNADDCFRCARQCVALYPQSANVLGMVAEYLLRHANTDNKEAIKLEACEYLHRAINQEHTNVFNFLTLMDIYLDDGDLEASEKLFARVLIDASNPYVMARRLRLLLLRNDVPAALQHYRQLLLHPVENDWVRTQPCQWFIEQQQKSAVWALLQEVAVMEPAPVLAARAWMHCLVAEGAEAKPVADALAKIASHQDFWREAIVYALHGEAGPEQLSVWLWQYSAGIKGDAVIWSALAAFRAGQNDFKAVRRMSATPVLVPAQASARALYFCSVAWRMRWSWEYAGSLCQQALGKPHDDTHHNLIFWEQFDIALQDRRKVSQQVLSGINLNELSRVERLLLEALQAFCRFPDGVDAGAWSVLQKDLHRIWHDYADIQENALLTVSRRKLLLAVFRQSQGALLWRALQTWLCL